MSIKSQRRTPSQIVRKALYDAGANLGIFRKSAPYMWPVTVEGMTQWQMGNFLNYAQDGFALNSIIYSTLMFKVRSITQAKPRAYIGDPMTPTILSPAHPLSRLLIRPNPYMSWMELIGLSETYLNLSGNAYIVIDRSKSVNGIPSGFWPVRPDEMFIIPKAQGLEGYIYVPKSVTWREGIPILPEDIIHIKFPNPMDNFEGLGYGLSPMSPLARSGDVDNSVTRFLKIFFDRGAMPNGLLQYDIPLDSDIVKEIKNRWRAIYGGIDNWTDVGVLDSGAKYQQLQMSFKEMGFTDLDMRNEERMIGPFGVPPILIGSRYGMEHATYSNYGEARTSFWEDTMIYEIRLFETEIQNAIVGNDGSYIAFDLSGVPALRQNVSDLADAAGKLFSIGVPADLALSTVGLHMPKLPYGDISYIPSTFRDASLPATSAGTVVGSEQTGNNNATPPTDNSPDKRRVAELELKRIAEREKKRKQTDDLVTIMDSWTNPFMDRAAACFEEDQKALLVMVNAAGRKAIQSKASIDWTEIEDPYDTYLKAESADRWRSAFTPMIGAVVSDAGKLWSGELGVKFDLRDVLAEDWFQDYTLEFAQPINDTTSGYIHDILAQAKAEGWSTQTTQENFQTVFQKWMSGAGDDETFNWLKTRLPDYRAEAIARTETNRAANGGSLALYKGWNVKKKSGVEVTTEGNETPT